MRRVTLYVLSCDIVQGLLQVLATVDARFSLPTPAWFQQFLKMLSAINLNFLTAMPAGCLVPWINFHYELAFQTLLPLVLISALAALAPLLRRCAKTRPHLSHLSGMCWSAIFLILFLAFPGCTAMLFDTFQCVSVTDGIDGGHSSEWLRVDLSIDCNGTPHKMMMGYAAFML